jgi:hypothetical protein
MYQPTANFALLASREENRVKSNRLPSQKRLHSFRGQITGWWQQAWKSETERQRFFVETALSLPNIGQHCTDFDAAFDALQFRSLGIKQRLRIAEW